MTAVDRAAERIAASADTADPMARLLARYRREGLAGVLQARRPDRALGFSVDPALPAARWAEPHRILLTGSTGYLGAWVLRELVARTDAEIVCLVRALDDPAAETRLGTAMSAWELPIARPSAVRVLAGDLADLRLGLSDEAWAQLAATVDCVVHCGALVSHELPYETLQAVNVGGTRTLLELATTRTRKAVHVVSSLDVLLASRTQRPLLETFDDPADEPTSGGYARTKWVAEQLVCEAIGAGLPASVVRVGSILGDRAGRPLPLSDLLVRALLAVLQQPGVAVLPDTGRVLDVLPVDFVAGALVDVVLDPDAWGGPIHLLSPARVAMAELADWVRAFGFGTALGPWESALSAPERRAAGLPQGLAAVPHPMSEQARDEAQHQQECARARRVLARTGRSWAAFDQAHLHTILGRLVADGALPQPRFEQGQSISDAGYGEAR
ncbi:MAG: thioester reductase domain-containing protein [Dermatophilaceae bacterium]